MFDPGHAARRERRARLARARRRRLRRGASITLVIVVALVGVAVRGAAESEPAKHPPSSSRAADPPRDPVTTGGPLAPAASGGLAALWAPENVVGNQPGSVAAYSAASRLPVGGTARGYLHIPDGMDFIPATPDMLDLVLASPDGAPDWAAVVHP